jgi:choline dehydrogenase-like flavoprotein
MTAPSDRDRFDAIVVGTGPGGATVARELSRRGARVLILERGGYKPLKDTVLATVTVLSAVPVGDDLVMGRALTTGGTTAVYLAATVDPPLDHFRSVGIELEPALDETANELPLAVLPDSLLRPHSLRLRDSAAALGHQLYTSRMLVDQSKCHAGYTYEAKWTARSYVEDARAHGAQLINRARVVRVLTEREQAVGVEYEFGTSKKRPDTRRAFASKIILAAGGATTPVILRRSGVRNVADRGIYCHPSFMLFGSISGLDAGDGFAGTWGFLLDGGIHIGDANFDRTLFRTVMLGEGQWLRALAYAGTIGMGVMVKDELSGGLDDNGRYRKTLSKEDHHKLAAGEATARRVLEHAGARKLVRSTITSSHIGGAIRIGEHLDDRLETELRNLHVCDGSVLPGSVNTPTLPLICLGKYLAGRIAAA